MVSYQALTTILKGWLGFCTSLGWWNSGLMFMKKAVSRSFVPGITAFACCTEARFVWSLWQRCSAVLGTGRVWISSHRYCRQALYWLLISLGVKNISFTVVGKLYPYLYPPSVPNIFSNLLVMMETAKSSETSVNFYYTTRRYIPEDIFILAALRPWNLTDSEDDCFLGRYTVQTGGYRPTFQRYTLIMEAVCSSETSVVIYQMTVFFWNLTPYRFLGHSPEVQRTRRHCLETPIFQNTCTPDHTAWCACELPCRRKVGESV
jgi:hypothetical protein